MDRRVNAAIATLGLTIACQATINVGNLSDTSSKETDADTTGTGTGSTTESTVTDPTTTTTVGTDPTATTSATDGTTLDPNTTGTSNGSTTDNSSTTEDSTTTVGTGTATDTTGGDTSSTSTTDTSTTDASTTDASTTDATTGDLGPGCPVGWTRARPVTITNAPDIPLTNFQVLVEVQWDDDMQVDFSDLRFVDGQGALLSHWIEDYVAPLEATVWVKVPAIAPAADTEITMCYGNPDATSASDGVATFVFFDGFDGNSLDPAKWETTYPVTVQMGAIKLTKGAIYTKSSPGNFPNLLVEAKGKLGFGGTYEPILQASSAQSALNPLIFMAWSGGYGAWNAMNQALMTGKLPNCCDPNKGGIIGVAVDNGFVHVFANRSLSQSAKGTWSKPFFIGLGYSTMKNASDEDLVDLTAEWLLVRKFTSVEPTTTVGPEMML